MAQGRWSKKSVCSEEHRLWSGLRIHPLLVHQQKSDQIKTGVYSMERILVTGGAGYKGALLIPQLLERGYKVLLYDSFMYGAQSILCFSSHPNLQIVEGDVRDAESLASEVKRCDTIIHLAGIVGYPACAADPQLANSVNVVGSLNLAMAMSPLQRLIFASTGSTYGRVDGICDETTPINPLTLYGRNKRDTEEIFTQRLKNYVILRFATVFGLAPRLRLDLLVNDFVHQAMHNRQIILYEGHHRRTFLHVRDAVNVYPFTLDHFDEMAGEVYNVGDDSGNYTKKEIAELINKQVDYYLHEADVGEDLDQRDYHVSYEKIRALGYRATIDINSGISELVKILKYFRYKNPYRNY